MCPSRFHSFAAPSSLTETKVCSSNTMAKKDLAAGAVYVNGAKGTSDTRVTTKDLIDGRVLVLRRGKANNFVVKAT